MIINFNNLIVLQNLPPEFHTDSQNSSKSAVLREILSDHYHLSRETSIQELKAAIIVCVAKESMELDKSKYSLVRDVIWKYYGYDSSPVKKRQLAKKEKTLLVEQNIAEREKIRLEKPLRLRSEKYRQWFAKKQERDEEKAKKLQEEKEFSYRIKQERNALRDKRGIERYFTPDMNNEVDKEIVRRMEELTANFSDPSARVESKCRKILAKRLSTGLSTDTKNIKLDTVIETRIESRCKLYNKTRNEIVRELFCVHFNIKQTDESKQINGCTTDLKVAQHQYFR